jgi:molecular chaperone GrpE
VKDKRADETVSPAAEPTGLEPVAPSLPSAAEFEALKAERDALKDQVLRRRADFENYRKRVERDRQHSAREAIADALKTLVPTLDNLDRARDHSGDGQSLQEGVELIHRDLLAALEGLGLKVQDPMGERYDPEIHEALSLEDVPGAEEGTIVEVLRKGYWLNDRLLRPALVKVAKAPQATAKGKAVH